MRRVIIITVGIAVLTLIVGTAISLTARADGPTATPASDVGLTLITLAVLTLATTAPYALTIGYHWAHDRGVSAVGRYTQYDRALYDALARGDTPTARMDHRAK